VRRSALHVLQRTGLARGPETLAAVRRSETTASNSGADAELRADVIGFVALSDAPSHRAMFEHLVTLTEPEAVQIAAIRAIGQIPGEEAGRFLL
jgi:hypothetical protein